MVSQYMMTHMKKIDLYIEDESLAQLNELHSMGFNKSRLVREAVKMYLSTDYIKSVMKLINERGKK